MRLQRKIVLLSTATLLTVVSVFGGVWLLAGLPLRQGVKEAANLHSVAIGKHLAAQVAATRAAYCSVVDDYLAAHSFPPEQAKPANFAAHIDHELGTAGGSLGSAKVSLRSPWNINPQHGISTEFELRGWEALLEQQSGRTNGSDPAEPYWERTRLNDGTDVVQVMSPDFAISQSCVDCHNELERSAEVRAMRRGKTIKQFQRGEMIGAVITTVPIAEGQALVAAVDQRRATLAWGIAVASCGCIVIGIGSCLYAGQRVAKSISEGLLVLEQVADGELIEPKLAEGNHETGRLSRSLRRLVHRIQTALEAVSLNADSLQESSGALTSVADDMSSAAIAATKRSSSASAAAEQLSVSTATVSQSAEKVSETIDKFSETLHAIDQVSVALADNAQRSTDMAKEAVEMVRESEASIDHLGTAASEVGTVLEVIGSIAEQTNLLALNATIEAARAGDAGKGFAVVASEVKELARQTTGATDDIRLRVDSIRRSTKNAIDSIHKIGGVIRDLDELSDAVADTVERQSETTQGISNNVSETTAAVAVVAQAMQDSAAASEEISRSIKAVDAFLRASAENAHRTSEAGLEFERLSREMHVVVQRFRQSSSTPTTVA